MKKLSLFVILLIALSANLFGQKTDKKEINKAFDEYMETVMAKDNAATLDFIYPPLFDFIPKSTMKEAMDQFYADPSTKIEYRNYQIIEISSTIREQGKKFALVSYTFVLFIQLNSPDLDENALNLTESSFKEIYGNNNVKLHRADKSFDITINGALYAIKDPAYTGWKFLEKNEAQKNIHDELLPPMVLKDL